MRGDMDISHRSSRRNSNASASPDNSPHFCPLVLTPDMGAPMLPHHYNCNQQYKSDNDEWKRNSFRRRKRSAFSKMRNTLNSICRKEDGKKERKGKRCLQRCFGWTLFWCVATYIGLYLFHCNVNGIGLLYLRTSLPFLPDEGNFDPLPASRTCVLQAFDQHGRDKYENFVNYNREWAEARGYQYYEYLQDDHNKRVMTRMHSVHDDSDLPLRIVAMNAKTSSDWTTLLHNLFPWFKFGSEKDEQENSGIPLEKPHYLKFHGMRYLFNEYDCDYVMYLDSDAVIAMDKEDDFNMAREDFAIPHSPDVDVVFGNEVIVAAMNSLERPPETLAFNSGFMLVRKSDWSMKLIHDVLASPRCDECRNGPCTLFGFYDQGCMEKLFRNEYSEDLHHVATARIQSTSLTNVRRDDRHGGFLICHLAGLSKDFYPDACGMLPNSHHGEVSPEPPLANDGLPVAPNVAAPF